MEDVPDALLFDLIAKIVSIQKKYAHVLAGVRNDRREEVKETLSRLVAERLES